jgi:hypothetical protein
LWMCSCKRRIDWPIVTFESPYTGNDTFPLHESSETHHASS